MENVLIRWRGLKHSSHIRGGPHMWLSATPQLKPHVQSSAYAARVLILRQQI